MRIAALIAALLLLAFVGKGGPLLFCAGALILVVLMLTEHRTKRPAPPPEPPPPDDDIPHAGVHGPAEPYGWQDFDTDVFARDPDNARYLDGDGYDGLDLDPALPSEQGEDW